MKVCIGGTFNILHKGHKLLIKKAFEMSGENGFVFIGISTGNLLKKKDNVKSFEERKKTLEKYITERGYTTELLIQPIKDKYGPSVEGDFDAIIVSPATYKVVEEINKKRKQKRKKPLEIIQIPFVLAKDGIPISSTRIKNKEVDSEGSVIERD